MATPRSTSSKSTKRTLAKSSAARAESSEASAPSSKPQPPAKAPESTSTSSNAPEFLVVAQVLGAHGVRGELKCRIVTDFPKQRFKKGNSVLISGQSYVVQAARIQGDQVLLKLETVADRDAAAAFRGADVEVPADNDLKLPRGQFYWHQVIGLQVEDVTTHELLGEVADIIETGANDVYIVK